jgi:hypothetical protein
MPVTLEALPWRAVCAAPGIATGTPATTDPAAGMPPPHPNPAFQGMPGSGPAGMTPQGAAACCPNAFTAAAGPIQGAANAGAGAAGSTGGAGSPRCTPPRAASVPGGTTVQGEVAVPSWISSLPDPLEEERTAMPPAMPYAPASAPAGSPADNGSGSGSGSCGRPGATATPAAGHPTGGASMALALRCSVLKGEMLRPTAPARSS